MPPTPRPEQARAFSQRKRPPRSSGDKCKPEKGMAAPASHRGCHEAGARLKQVLHHGFPQARASKTFVEDSGSLSCLALGPLSRLPMLAEGAA